MHVRFRRQHRYAATWLDEMKHWPCDAGNVEALTAKHARIVLPGINRLMQLDRQPFFAYDIFPNGILTAHTEWSVEDRFMQPGDTIVQEVHLPPFSRVSLKLVFGVRISHVSVSENRWCFAYQTLKGHVEKGESVFTLEAIRGRVWFSIATHSAPASAWMPAWLTSPYQDYCTRMALQHVQRQYAIII